MESSGDRLKGDEGLNLSTRDLHFGFLSAGIGSGSVVLIHAALRTFGVVDGGSVAVRDALLGVLGTAGTLVAPTFTFAHEKEEMPLIQPDNDVSEMGAITEAVRLHPSARRSIAYRHSFAAVGPASHDIVNVDHRLAPFDEESVFGRLLSLDAHVLLLGVPYSNSTSHHFAEWLADVPYRHRVERRVRLKSASGDVFETMMGDYQPKPSKDGSYYGTRGADFNRLGLMLETRGLVDVVSVGNAVVRRFRMADLVELALAEAKIDYNVFRTPEGQRDFVTQLPDGELVRSGEVLDGAGRPSQHVWSVVSASGMFT